jgi:predicted ATP-dependent endonuclease of OLD family
VVPLRRVRIENFRGVRALELPLDPEVTVIFGGNAGGKTTLLDALAVLLGEVVRLFLPDADARRSVGRCDCRL